MTDQPKTPNAAPSGVEWQILQQSAEYNPDEWRGFIASKRDDIERLRKRDITIKLVDRAGKPLAGKAVRAVQTESDFLWGFNTWGLMNAMRSGAAKTDHVQRQMRLYAELFNSANLLHYWMERVCTDAPASEEFQGFPDYENIQEAVDWAMASGLTPKGHPIFWPVDKAIPEWLHKYDYETKMKFLEIRVRTLVSRFKGKIKLYDAVNEAIWEPSFRKTAERHWPHMTPVDEMVEYIAPILQWAREEDPDARFMLNDYGVMVGHMEEIPIVTNDGRYINRDTQARRYQELVLALKEAGAAPDAVGIQGFFGPWGHFDLHAATLDLLGTQTGLPVVITEFQPGGKQTEDLEKAGVPREEIIDRMWGYVENALITAFAHPSVEGFYFWYNQEYLFGPRGGRPSTFYKRLYDLIHNQWRTDASLQTDANGLLTFRGFCGDYSLRLETPGAQSRTVKFKVSEASRGEIALTLAVGV